jgi:hypothetical protein
MRQIRRGTETQVDQILVAIDALRIALRELKGADCPKTAIKVRAALKSADGARRHLEHRVRRSSDEQLGA